MMQKRMAEFKKAVGKIKEGQGIDGEGSLSKGLVLLDLNYHRLSIPYV